jgi:uncharacterized protein YjbJ (UPF0337 family)
VLALASVSLTAVFDSASLGTPLEVVNGGETMQVGRVDVNKLRGVTDKAFGLTKEFVGVLVGNDKLQEEGEAQQERATEELKALRKELKAQKKESVAEMHEQREKTAQRAKSA